MWPKLKRIQNPKYQTSTYEDRILYEPKSNIDLNELKLRQRFIESGFDDNKVSSAGAVGRFQIMPSTGEEYARITGNTGNLTDPTYNEKIRDYYINTRIPQMLKRKNSSDSSAIAQGLFAYVAGAGNANKELDRLEALGEDVNNSTKWVNKIKNGYAKNYIKFTFLKDSVNRYLNDQEYEKAKKKHGFK